MQRVRLLEFCDKILGTKLATYLSLNLTPLVGKC